MKGRLLTLWALGGVLALAAGTLRGNFWRTPDQQGDLWMARNHPDTAAGVYLDPARRAAAFYRAAEFKQAARIWRGMRSAEASFNMGNALLMQGLYEESIEAFEEALHQRPGWFPATNNLAIAQARASRVKAEGGEMTDGMLAADEIAFTEGSSPENGGEEVDEDPGGTMSDQEIQALWLKRVQTKPADFLKAKFASQLSMEDNAE